MEICIAFRGRKPVPQRIDVGMERENKVTVLRFEGLPKLDGTAYLQIAIGDKSDSIQIVDGKAEITRTLTQHTGEAEAYVEVLGAEDRVWRSRPFALVIGELPLIGEQIAQAYPTSFEQVLTQTAQSAKDAAASAQAAADTAAEIVVDEQARQAAETTRQQQEAARVKAETARQTAENAREQAEDARKTAEQERASAEASRATAEQGRVTAESNRETAEAAREEADELLEVAKQNATEGMTLEERMKALETRAMEQDEALMELTGMLAETETGEN